MELRHKSQTYKSEKWKFTKTVKQGIMNFNYSRKNILEASVNLEICSMFITNLQVN